MNTILMTKEVWINSQLSIARFYGEVRINGDRYILLGDEQDLVYDKYAIYYKWLGREKFMQVLEHYQYTDEDTIKKAMKEELSKLEMAIRLKQKQNNKQQTKLEL